jgi:hypothetical protein
MSGVDPIMDDSTQEVVVLTKESGIASNTIPTGRVLGLVPIPQSSMVQIQFVDGKPGGIPDEIGGIYTSVRYAQNHLTDYVKRFWSLSELATKKRPSSNAISG